MIDLTAAECDFQLSSVMDPVGHLFKFEGRILRAIRAPYVDAVLRAIALATKHQWFDLGLIPTWTTEYCLPEYPLIIEHKVVPFMTVRAEWGSEALKEAALCFLRLATALAPQDLCLKDSHTWNLLFDASKPYFVDWGSIRPISELNWEAWYLEFRKYFLAPLHLFSMGQSALARAMMREHWIGAGNVILDMPFSQQFPQEPNLIYQRRSQCSAADVFSALAKYVSSLTFPHVNGEWARYEQPRFNGLAKQNDLRKKDQIVHRLMASDPYATVLDIGCNYGVHSEICAALGKRVVALDVEEPCVDDLFMRTKASGRDILPLWFDFRWPIGESGFMNTIPSVHDRLTCDTVLVMAVVHHLACRQGASFDAIAWNISRFARRRAIVEFIPVEDVHVAQWPLEHVPWYNLENFLAAMTKYFGRHQVLDSDPSPRQLIVFEDKRDRPPAAAVPVDNAAQFGALSERALQLMAGVERSMIGPYKQRLRDLEQAQRLLQNEITSMESSKFWRLRNRWMKVKNGLRRVVGG